MLTTVASEMSMNVQSDLFRNAAIPCTNACGSMQCACAPQEPSPSDYLEKTSGRIARCN